MRKDFDDVRGAPVTGTDGCGSWCRAVDAKVAQYH